MQCHVSKKVHWMTLLFGWQAHQALFFAYTYMYLHERKMQSQKPASRYKQAHSTAAEKKLPYQYIARNVCRVILPIWKVHVLYMQKAKIYRDIGGHKKNQAFIWHINGIKRKPWLGDAQGNVLFYVSVIWNFSTSMHVQMNELFLSSNDNLSVCVLYKKKKKKKKRADETV